MKLGQEIRYLSNADVVACGLRPAEVIAAVESMFAAKAAGQAAMKPKIGLHEPDKAWFLASAGIMNAPAYSGVKWVGVGDNHARGLPHIAGLILLSDAETGMPVALMDATWITGMRTAAITAVAAKYLARPESRSIGFVACGLQARTHLEALRTIFPLAQVTAYSRRLETAERFAEEVRGLGLAGDAVADPRAAVEGMDIVVTTTPAVPPTPPFLDASWLSPGAFAGMVDLGLPWIAASLNGLDCVVTDDLEQSKTERLCYEKPFAGEVADLVSGNLPGRRDGEDRTAIIFAGIGLADVAAAALVYDTATKSGVGKLLTL